MDDLLTEFLTETNEGLNSLDRYLLELEKNPDNLESVRTIFRVIHTIKGTCGFLNLTRLENVSHATENVLGYMRDGKLSVNPTLMGTLFAAVDRLKAIVAALEVNEEERNPHEDKVIIDLLNLCLSNNCADSLLQETQALFQQSLQPAKDDYEIFDSKGDAEEQKDGGDVSSSEASLTAETGPNLADLDNTQPLNLTAKTDNEIDELEALTQNPELLESLVSQLASPVHKKESLNIPITPENPASSPTKKDEIYNNSAILIDSKQSTPLSQQFIRVHIDVLDNLITLISELVLTRNQLLQLMQTAIDPIFNVPLSRLSYITTELQEEVMKTRMQTIESAWAKFPRLIHDLSKELGKKIELIQLGGNTELDRQVLELIKDPLTHMIRNSADHGLETPHTRLAAGKPETGTITLKAFHEGGQIVIEISDDGAGIDPVKLKKKLIEKGMLTADEAMTISDWQAINYIFKPGFSTASEVTHVSGRGVGMDVVKSNIEKLSGTIDLQSSVGKGTCFTIKIPLTLTIISALIFESQGQRFAIPQLSVTELVRVSPRSSYQVEYINKTPILRLRNGLLPLIFLEQLLGIQKNTEDIRLRELCVIVVHFGTMGFGIVVDRVFDTQEIVVKPLSRVFSQIRFFSGSTILGDGGIVLILDQNSIANQLKELTGAHTQQAVFSHFRPISDKTLLLVFQVQEKRYAVPLALVTRIAEISKKQLEYTNGTWLIHYQDHLLPIAKFEGNWTTEEIKGHIQETMPLLIFSDRGYAMGLAIEEIVNIIECDLSIEIANKADGSLGTTIIQGHTTSIVDCEYYLQKAFPAWFDHRSIEVQEGVRKIKVLFVDDSQFFRNLFMPLLTLAGFDVVTATNGLQGLEHAKHRSDFDIIVSDIEMPEMSGFDLAIAIRNLDAYKHTTLIAMTSRTSEADIAYCYECGYNYHFPKTQQKQLINKIEELRKEMLNEEYHVYEPDLT